MSHEAQTWALKIRTGNPLRKAVLMYLANRANTEDGVSWPSQARVAEETEMDERTVRKHLLALEDMGIIRRRARRDTTDLIWINFDYREPEKPAANDNDSGPRRGAGREPAESQPAESDSGTDRNDGPVVAESRSGTDRTQNPPNRNDEPSENRQDEPPPERTAAPWPEDYRKQFQDLYPKRRNNDWREAFIKLDRINKEGQIEFATIMTGLRSYADAMKKRVAEDPNNRKFIAMVTTWLNQQRWVNETPGEDPSSMDAARARTRASKVWV